MMKKSVTDYKLIIFDMDGTLYFQRPLQIHMALKMLAACFKPNGIREIMTVLKFRKLRESWDTPTETDENIDQVQYMHLSSQIGLSADETEQIIQKWIYEKPLSIIAKYRDNTLFEIIKKYHLQSKQVVIYSDYPAKDKCASLGFPSIPCFYGGQEEIGCMKPNPKGLTYIMSTYNIINPGDVLMIGDRMSKDGQAAIAAGTDYLILKKYRLQRKTQYPLLFSE